MAGARRFGEGARDPAEPVDSECALWLRATLAREA